MSLKLQVGLSEMGYGTQVIGRTGNQGRICLEVCRGHIKATASSCDFLHGLASIPLPGASYLFRDARMFPANAVALNFAPVLSGNK